MFEPIAVIFAILGLLYASYTDIKHRIVPNKLVLFLFASGIVLHLCDSFVKGSFMPIVFCIGAAAMVFLFSYILWRMGAWAGGDVKFFSSLAALLPTPFMGSVPFFYHLVPLFPFLILINSVIVSFPFVMLYVLWKTLTKKHLRKRFSQMIKKSVFNTVVYACSLIGFYFVLDFMNINTVWIIPALLVISFFPTPMKIGIPAALTFLSLIVSKNINESITTFISVFVFMLFFETLTYGRKYALRKRVRVKHLEEGMIPAHTLYLDGNKVKAYEPTFIQKIMEPFHEPKTTIISRLRAAGITKAEIDALKQLGVKTIMVKESIPMIPIVLLGTIVSLFIGDIIWIVMSII